MKTMINATRILLGCALTLHFWAGCSSHHAGGDGGADGFSDGSDGGGDKSDSGGDPGPGHCPPDPLCGSVCCAADELCLHDVCVKQAATCVTDGECQDDSYCDAGHCIPYGSGPRGDTNPDCTRLVVAGLFQPALQCEWTGPPAGDPYPAHVQVLGTPVVVDFDFDNDPETVRPSIVFNTYDGLDGDSGCITELDGVLRIIDGATCQTQFTLGPYLNGSNPVAVGDLDNDGRPEIVAHRNLGGTLAYRYDAGSGAWATLWEAHDAGGNPLAPGEAATHWGGPSLLDLDDDGVPEVLSGGLVYDSRGLLLDDALGLAGVHAVGFPVAADLDGDGRVELANGNGIWEWDAAAHVWKLERAFGGAHGYVAVADFGTYTPAGEDRTMLDGVPEIAVVENGQARLDALDGRTVFGPVAIPSSAGGGPPTIGDFDGDGRAELAASGSDSMTIFDPDCRGVPQAATCPTLRSDGILWSQPSQDHSSNITGSSLFDFEGDGKVEAVYADECFVRVYRGSDGTVLYSQWRSSCTWNENPVVADVDGDYSAELVVPSNESCENVVPSSLGGRSYDVSPGGHPMDPLFAGLPCKGDSDCAHSCLEGFCRCTADADCGGGGFVCAPPPAGTPGAGNTCRAEWRGKLHGVRVYRDTLDRWVGSRPIWNQHAYAVTNVEDDGRIPRTSTARKNWQVPGLNNFRQNVQGDLNPEHIPDLTSGRGDFDPGCVGSSLSLHARVCNRGTNPIAAGVSVGFYLGDPAAGGTRVCAAQTQRSLAPGECETVDCTWDGATEYGQDITVVVDDGSERSECLEENNRGIIRGAHCPPA
ncbi:MAG: hypothetical protein GYA21_04870 [Myxococcales bacterium]|nr:hypothetical protein [Myxococcales bacterium]